MGSLADAVPLAFDMVYLVAVQIPAKLFIGIDV